MFGIFVVATVKLFSLKIVKALSNKILIRNPPQNRGFLIKNTPYNPITPVSLRTIKLINENNSGFNLPHNF